MADIFDIPGYTPPFTGKANFDKMDIGFMDNFGQMADEYYQQTGKPLQVNDAWRSRATQADAYFKKPKLAAPPGHSLHEKGMAMDIDPDQANELDQSGLLAKYGFERPMLGQGKSGKNEPWHIQTAAFERKAGKIAASTGEVFDIPNFQEGQVQDIPNFQGSPQPAGTQQVGPETKIEAPQELTAGQKVAQAVAPYARPALEMGGMAAGGITAGAGTYGLGTALGAGLGYASGKKAADILDAYAGKKKAQDLPQIALDTGKDIAMGAGMELGAQGLGVIGKSVGDWVASKVAPKLYESALKIPPVSVPADVREKVVQKGIEGQYLPNKTSLERLKQESFDLARQVDGIISKGASYGKTIDTEKVLSRVGELGKFYENLPDPRPYMEQLEASKQAILEYRGQTIPVDVAQQIKKNLYTNLRKSYGEMKTISKEFDKSVARGIKEELETQFPELAAINAKLSDKINLEQVLTRAVHRVRNYDVIRLGDTVAATAGAAADGPQGLGLAFLAKRVLEAPQVKSYLAFILNRAGGLSGKALAPIAEGNMPVGFTGVPFSGALTSKPRE